MNFIDNAKKTRKNKRVLILKAEPLEKDARVIKEIRTLYSAGYDLSLITWGTYKDIPNPLLNIPISKTVFNFPRPLGLLHVPFLPLWWLFVIVFSLFEKWDILHVINIHSIIPGVIVAKIKRKPIVYEIEDVYEDSLPVPFLRSILLAIDKKIIKMTSAVIFVDDAQIGEFSINDTKNVIIIYDSPEDCNQTRFRKRNPDNFIIFYDGVLERSRKLLLEEFFSAINAVSGVQIIICGGGDLVEEIEQWCRRYPQKFSYLGYIPYNEVIRNSLDADLLPALRSSQQVENVYNCGSKLLKSMMCGRPALVNRGTSGARKVQSEECGLIVDATDVQDLIKALELLKNDPVLCSHLGENARKAYEERYGWHIMSKRLITLYDSFK